MDWLVESIGILGGVAIYGAALLRGLIPIKACILVAALLFLAYGVILGLPAIIIVNVVGTAIATYGLVRAIRSRDAKK